MTTPTGQLAIKDIAAVADVSRAAVSNWRARHDDFPQPTQDSPQRRPLFDLQEVITWLKKKDLLPEGADKKQAALALTAAANELRRRFRRDQCHNPDALPVGAAKAGQQHQERLHMAAGLHRHHHR